MNITTLTAWGAEVRPHARRLLCRCRTLLTLDTRTVKALLPATVAAWLATRCFTDGFAFHLLGLLIVVLAALRMRKERALLTALVVVMVDSEGVLYRPAAAPVSSSARSFSSPRFSSPTSCARPPPGRPARPRTPAARRRPRPRCPTPRRSSRK